MKTGKAAALVLMSFLCFAMSFAKETETPLEQLRTATQFEFLMCRLKFTSAQLSGEANSADAAQQGADYYSCTGTAQKKTQADYKRAIKFVEKKPAAVAAIKAYYAAWIGAVRGITPGTDEIKLAYSTRQTQSNQRLDELWAKVELEAGF